MTTLALFVCRGQVSSSLSAGRSRTSARPSSYPATFLAAALCREQSDGLHINNDGGLSDDVDGANGTFADYGDVGRSGDHLRGEQVYRKRRVGECPGGVEQVWVSGRRSKADWD